MNVVVSSPVMLYMGKDKFESTHDIPNPANTILDEDLIKHGLPHDVWVFTSGSQEADRSSMLIICPLPMYTFDFRME